MKSNTLRIEDPLLSELYAILDPRQSFASFVKEVLKNEIDRRNKTKAAIAYTKFLDENPDEESLLAEWDSVDLEAPLKTKKKSNKKSKKI